MKGFVAVLLLYVTVWLEAVHASIRPFTELTHACHHLPVSGFLTSQQLDLICHHREQWMNDRDALSSKTVVQETTGRWIPSLPISAFQSIPIVMFISSSAYEFSCSPMRKTHQKIQVALLCCEHLLTDSLHFHVVDQLKYLRDLEDCTRHNCIEVARRRRRKVTGHVLLVPHETRLFTVSH